MENDLVISLEMKLGLIDENSKKKVGKLEGLKVMEINFELYRKTIFESISLLQELS